MADTPKNTVKNAIQPDNSLCDTMGFFHWHPTDDTIRMAGYFTAEQLLAIARHMQKHAAE